MPANKKNELDLSLKLEMLRYLLSGKSIEPLIKNMPPDIIPAAHRFMWEKTLEFGLKSQGKSFSSDKVLVLIEKLSHSQNNKCIIKISYNDKINKNIENNLQKMASQIIVMCNIVKGYLNHS